MLLTATDPRSKRVKVEDARGKPIKWVTSFDTETKEAEILIPVESGKNIAVILDGGICKPLKIKAFLPGCKAINLDTREEIK